MSPALLDLKGGGSGDLCTLGSSVSIELRERNYLGFSDCSSVDSSAASTVLEGNKNCLNLKATELRLGLPGSLSPERESEVNLLSRVKRDEKPLFPLVPSKNGICSSSQKAVVSGNKRGFSDTVVGFSGVEGSLFGEGNWMLGVAGSVPETPRSLAQGKVAGINGIPNISPGTQSSVTKEIPLKVSQERSRAANETNHNYVHGATNNSNAPAATNNSNAPAAKAQVVGWPPIRSFRKNTLATTSKNPNEVDGQPGPGALFVKVSMDGAPYLRKVDLRTYLTYQELSSALEKMFSCFTIGQCGSQGATGKELSETKLRDLLHGSEYVLTYEDKDGDWMLVGDVPWEMFIDSCKRLKIMKGTDAIGLAPRAMEKSRNRN